MEPAEQKYNSKKYDSLSPKRKDLSQLLNINAKFAGTGGSKKSILS